LKRWSRIGLLLAIKESYLLTKNVLGLWFHPYKTLKLIFTEKDRSQQLLVLGLPAYLLAVGTFVVWLGRRLWATTPEWGRPAKLTAAGVIGLTAALGIYLVFWLMEMVRTERRYGKS